ncbi:MAG: rane protein [Massilibacillus sp.]|jgi:H+/gluconate symporter-like permease|nr:rane protein [Massilibacillus sp.]
METAGFNIWWGLLGLLPLGVYVILVFRDMDPLPVTVLCVIIGAILTSQSLVSFATVMANAMGSFLALVGLIIMLGRGLGEVLTETKVSHALVHKIIYSIGVDTENKAMFGMMIACLVVVGLLGTMAGGNAILAPIILPIAAAAGLTRSTVGVLFQACGEEALILGPFTPPVIALLGLTHTNYGEMLLKVALPIAAVTLVTTWIVVHRIQKKTKGKNDYDIPENVDKFIPTHRENWTSVLFIVTFIAAVVYGIVMKAGTAYVIVVMLSLSLITGLAGGLNIDRIFKLIIKGMAGNVGLFILFLFLEPFMNFIEQAGGFKALGLILQPFVNMGGKPFVAIIGGLTGAFGLTGATVAVMKMLNDMFGTLVTQYGVSMAAWSVGLVVATRVANFVYPGSNMFSSMGFAESKDIKSMIKNGVIVAAMQIVFLIIYANLFS